MDASNPSTILLRTVAFAFIATAGLFYAFSITHIVLLLWRKLKRRREGRINFLLLLFFAFHLFTIAVFLIAIRDQGESLRSFLNRHPGIAMPILGGGLLVLPSIGLILNTQFSSVKSRWGHATRAVTILIAFCGLPLAGVATQMAYMWALNPPHLASIINPPNMFAWSTNASRCVDFFPGQTGAHPAWRNLTATLIFWLDATIQAATMDIPASYGCSFARLQYRAENYSIATFYVTYKLFVSSVVVSLLLGSLAKVMLRRMVTSQREQ